MEAHGRTIYGHSYFRIPDSLGHIRREFRVPEYIDDLFVWDENRRAAADRAIESLRLGKKVLIVGSSGCGKSAFLYMLWRKILETGVWTPALYTFGRIYRTHEQLGIIIFIDDLHKLDREIIEDVSISEAIVATVRAEEIEK